MCAQHPVIWPVKNGPEDDCSIVETCSPHITLCNNKYSRADVQFFSITVRIVALRDAFIQITFFDNLNIENLKFFFGLTEKILQNFYLIKISIFYHFCIKFTFLLLLSVFTSPFAAVTNTPAWAASYFVRFSSEEELNERRLRLYTLTCLCLGILKPNILLSECCLRPEDNIKIDLKVSRIEERRLDSSGLVWA